MKKIVHHPSTREPPASGRPPSLPLTPRDVQASADELVGFHHLFQSVFQRREQREWSLFYLCGQLVNLPRKTIESMVLHFRGADRNAIRALQQFISQATWPAGKLILRQQHLVADWLGDPQGVVIVDGSGFPKQGQDCGGSNGNTCWVWKVRLQAFADEFNLTITVTHYPTGASKWNRIEHRLFCLISGNWAGIPLDSFETVLKHIRTTRSSTGLRCRACLAHREYPTRIKATSEEIAHLRIRYHKTFPQWNYTIYPHRKPN